MNDVEFSADLQSKILTVWNEGQTELLPEIAVTDFVRHEPFAGLVDGREAMAEHVLGFRIAYPDLTITIDESLFDGQVLVTHWRYRGTNLGEVPGSGLPATGKEVDFRGASVMHIENGKMVDEYVYYNLLGVMQTLGLIPEPTT